MLSVQDQARKRAVEAAPRAGKGPATGKTKGPAAPSKGAEAEAKKKAAAKRKAEKARAEAEAKKNAVGWSCLLAT